MDNTLHQDDYFALNKSFIIFQIGNEEYGLNLACAKEIIKNKEITKIPNLEDYISGVINLRGSIIPIINLRKRLNLGKNESADNNDKRIIVVQAGDSLVGLLVDLVNGVETLNDLEDIAEKIDIIDQSYIKSIGKLNDRLIIIIDIDRVVLSSKLKE